MVYEKPTAEILEIVTEEKLMANLDGLPSVEDGYEEW